MDMYKLLNKAATGGKAVEVYKPNNSVSIENGTIVTYYGKLGEYGDDLIKVCFREFNEGHALLLSESTMGDADLHLNSLLWYAFTMNGYVPKALPKDDNFTFEVKVHSIIRPEDFK